SPHVASFKVQVFTSAGNFPPLAASFAMTCLCNQTFMVAESLVSPVYFNSFASSFLAAKLLYRSSAFIRSTMYVLLVICLHFAAAFETTAAMSIVFVGDALADVGDAVADDGVGAPGAVGGAPGANVGEAPAACAEPWPKILPIIFPKTLMTLSSRLRD